ncbi:uncharacterized protein LOC119269074 [Triticum dicoccoides]|uniref:uncharacterized protein LOC119269074 n=1 Tax=Triticum dicoccoides TaxID=85692 RepID=UPI00188E9254|nr:uncharacterized protein LOC119269074 [Triticum dicoccoides]XP_037406719.1 uncharacterized protein LOC119269074 [Triticum dicoccoides]
MKANDFSGCHCHLIDGFAAVVGRNIINGRGKAGRLRRATTPSGRPRKAALQLRLVPLPISMFVPDPAQGRGRRGGREEKLQVAEVEEEDEPVEELKKGRGRKKEAKPKQYNDYYLAQPRIQDVTLAGKLVK